MSQIKAKLISHWGPGDQRVAEAAWASTYDQDKWENRTEEQRDKVLDIVIGHGHGTPLESVWLEFYIECPIFVERQLDKYRMTQQYQDINDKEYTDIEANVTQMLKLAAQVARSSDATTREIAKEFINVADNFRDTQKRIIEYHFGPMGRDNITQNELSGRYRTIPNRFLEMPDDVADITSRGRFFHDGEGNNLGAKGAKDWYHQVVNSQYCLYKSTLTHLKEAVTDGRLDQSEYKRAREFLRGMLGTAFITHMKLVLNLRAFENILRERLASDAQPEIQQVAKLMLKEVIDNKVAPKAIQKMIETNRWERAL